MDNVEQLIHCYSSQQQKKKKKRNANVQYTFVVKRHLFAYVLHP